MAPKLLPKPSPADGLQFSDSNQGHGYRDHPTSAGAISRNRTKELQNFEFVNVTGSKKPDASSQTLIRSHVMREVKRGEQHRKSQTPSERAESIRDSAKGVPAKDAGIMQVQRLRMGSTGLEPMHPPKRAKRSRNSNTLLHRPKASLQENAVARQGAFSLNNESVIVGQLLPAVPLTGFDSDVVLHHSIGGRATAAEFCWPASYSLFGSTNKSGSSASGRQSLDSQEPETESQVRPWPQGPPKTSPEKIWTKKLDLFNTMPVQTSRRTELLVYHFHHRINVSSLMMNARKCWFVLAIKDQAFLIIALSHAAGHLSLLEKRGDPNEALNLRNEAIRIVNNRLSQAQYGISEATFGAVASMASYEATNGSLSSTQTHMDGLEQMVNTRGGVLQHEFSPHMRRLIAWADINAAVALSTPPKFPSIEDLIPDASSSCHPPQMRNRSSSSSLQRYQGLIYHQSLDHRLVSSFLDIYDLTQFLGVQNYEPGSEMDHSWFGDKVYSIQRRLASVLEDGQNHQSGIEKSFCIAALIYVKCVLRCVSPNANIVGMLTSKLCTSMRELFEGSIVYDQADSCSKLCLWTLFVGGAAALDESERAWFILQLTFLCDFLELYEWKATKAALQDCSWPETEIALVGRLVWEEIQEVRAVNQGLSGLLLDEV